MTDALKAAMLNTCIFCSLVIYAGEKRTTYRGKPCHYDCLADFELDRIEDQEARS